MSEQIDIFREMKVYTQQRKARARNNAPAILETAGVKFSVHNNGGHLKCTRGSWSADFWPGTGKWNACDIRKGMRPRIESGRGIANLLRRFDVIDATIQAAMHAGQQIQEPIDTKEATRV